jgi:hypothetical protein
MRERPRVVHLAKPANEGVCSPPVGNFFPPDMGQNRLQELTRPLSYEARGERSFSTPTSILLLPCFNLYPKTLEYAGWSVEWSS